MNHFFASLFCITVLNNFFASLFEPFFCITFLNHFFESLGESIFKSFLQLLFPITFFDHFCNFIFKPLFQAVFFRSFFFASLLGITFGNHFIKYFSEVHIQEGRCRCTVVAGGGRLHGKFGELAADGLGGTRPNEQLKNHNVVAVARRSCSSLCRPRRGGQERAKIGRGAWSTGSQGSESHQ